MQCLKWGPFTNIYSWDEGRAEKEEKMMIITVIVQNFIEWHFQAISSKKGGIGNCFFILWMLPFVSVDLTKTIQLEFFIAATRLYHRTIYVNDWMIFYYCKFQACCGLIWKCDWSCTSFSGQTATSIYKSFLNTVFPFTTIHKKYNKITQTKIWKTLKTIA